VRTPLDIYVIISQLSLLLNTCSIKMFTPGFSGVRISQPLFFYAVFRGLLCALLLLAILLYVILWCTASNCPFLHLKHTIILKLRFASLRHMRPQPILGIIFILFEKLAPTYFFLIISLSNIINHCHCACQIRRYIFLYFYWAAYFKQAINEHLCNIFIEQVFKRSDSWLIIT
jgi:hypothetical protein